MSIVIIFCKGQGADPMIDFFCAEVADNFRILWIRIYKVLS